MRFLWPRVRKVRAAMCLVAILAIAVASVGSFRSWAEARSVAQQARDAVSARRGDRAHKLIDRWAELCPKGGEPDYYRARLHVQADRPAEALDAIRRSLAQGYDEEPLLTLRAVLLARSGRLDQAEPVLARAFATSAEPRVEVAEALSRIYLKTFRLPKAIQVIESWRKAAPDDPRPYLRRNEVDERTESDPGSMIRNYREALRRDPGLMVARLGLAEKLLAASLFDEADAEYSILLERDPKSLRGLVGAGQVALMKGNLDDSIRHFEAALAIDPKEKVALREIGLIDLKRGQVSKACSLLKLAVDVDPYDPEIRYSYARALKIAGEDGRAAEESAMTDRLKKEHERIIGLRRSLVARPDDVELRSEAAKWLIEHGHEAEGLEWTQLILRRWPGHPPTCQVLADYHAKRGEIGLANYYRLTIPSEVTHK